MGELGPFLWKGIRALGADIFITGEAKYNDYFDCEGSPSSSPVVTEAKIASRLLLAEIIFSENS